MKWVNKLLKDCAVWAVPKRMACDLSPFKAIPFVTYKFLVDNDTVSISVWRVGCIRSRDCRYTVDGSNMAAAAYVDNGRVDGPLSHVLPNISRVIFAAFVANLRHLFVLQQPSSQRVARDSAYAPKSRSNISPEANPQGTFTALRRCHNDDFCEARLPLLCSGCFQLTTENCR